MSADPTELFEAFDRGRLTRRQLLVALGVATFLRPASVLTQSACRPGQPDCDTTPAKPPFEATGWKTVCLDRFHCQVADYAKEAAYYDALVGWKIRSDNGTQALLDIGDWGGILLRGGYQAPPAAPRPAAPAPSGETGAPSGAPAGGGGRGSGRGGPRVPRLAAVDGFCWGIEPWDTKKVEAELRKRGLDPVADHDGKDFQSFHVKDPDGFNVQISNATARARHRTAPAGKVSAAAPFDPTGWKTVWLDHISFEVTDYKESVAFYTALLGWTPGPDTGSQSQCQIGEVGDIIIRRGARPGARGADPSAAPAARHASIGHIAFGIGPWDADKIKAELDKRSLTSRPDSGICQPFQTAVYQSYHTTTPNGFDLQISNATHATREVSAQCS